MGGGQQPAVRVQVDPRGARRRRPRARGRAHGARRQRPSTSPRARVGGDAQRARHRRQRSAASAPTAYRALIVALPATARAVRLGDVAARHRRRREQPRRRLDRRQALGAADHPPPAGRQHHRDHRAHQGAPARAARQSISPAIDVEVALDRTQTIRASVRRRRAHARCSASSWWCWWSSCSCAARAPPSIPSVAVPLSLVGTFGVMYLLRLQPRQPVADGAHHLDRLRRRRRHRRHREHRALRRAGRAAAARRRSRARKQIGFTIVSITVSLLAVFIPILLMGGIVGRLFREFAVTLSIAIARLGGRLAHADADDVRAPAARRGASARTAGSTASPERVFERAAARLRARRSRWVLRPPRARCWCVTLATLGAHRLPVSSSSPRACSRSRTPACSPASPRRRRTSRSPAMRDAPGGASTRSCSADPDVAHVVSFIGGGGGSTRQHRHHVHDAQAATPTRKATRRRGHRPPAPQAGARPGHHACSCRRRRTCASAAAPSRTQYQYTLQDADLDELRAWAPRVLERAAQAARAEGRHHRSADRRPRSSTSTIDRDTAARLGITPQAIDDTLYDAFGQRQVATTFTAAATSTAWCWRRRPSYAQRPGRARPASTCARRRAALVPLSQRSRSSSISATPLSINHQGQFPAVTLSFNLAPGVALGQAVDAIHARRARDRPAGQRPAPTSRAPRRPSAPRSPASRC